MSIFPEILQNSNIYDHSIASFWIVQSVIPQAYICQSYLFEWARVVLVRWSKCHSVMSTIWIVPVDTGSKGRAVLLGICVEIDGNPPLPWSLGWGLNVWEDWYLRPVSQKVSIRKLILIMKKNKKTGSQGDFELPRLPRSLRSENDNCIHIQHLYACIFSTLENLHFAPKNCNRVLTNPHKFCAQICAQKCKFCAQKM